MLANKLNYQQEKITRKDGSHYNLIELKAADSASIAFKKIENINFERKLFDIAQLRLLKAAERGIKKPVVIVWAAYEHQLAAEDYFPEALAELEEEYLSLNALITQKLRELIKTKNYLIKNKRLQVKELKNKGLKLTAAIISLLEKEKRIKFYAADPQITTAEIYQNLDYQRDLAAVGAVDYLSDYAFKHQYPLSFNCSFFLLEAADWESKYSLLGDQYGLLISEGKIISPPLYKRSALLKDQDNNWELKKLSLADLELKIQSQNFDLSKFSLNKDDKHSLYTRYFGVKAVGEALGKTPIAKDKIEIIIINNFVVGIKKGGGVKIPQNAFILSIPIQKLNFDLQKSKKVNYTFKTDSNYITAVQTGPQLVNDYKIVLNQKTLAKEEFFGRSKTEVRAEFKRVVPTDYAADIDQNRAARMVARINSKNEFCLLAVEAVNKGMALVDESSGATLLELAEIAQQRDYKYALNLDGGGSANIQYLYGNLIKTADRRGLPGVVYERMVPSLGYLEKL